MLHFSFWKCTVSGREETEETDTHAKCLRTFSEILFASLTNSGLFSFGTEYADNNTLAAVYFSRIKCTCTIFQNYKVLKFIVKLVIFPLTRRVSRHSCVTLYPRDTFLNLG